MLSLPLLLLSLLLLESLLLFVSLLLELELESILPLLLAPDWISSFVACWDAGSKLARTCWPSFS